MDWFGCCGLICDRFMALVEARKLGQNRALFLLERDNQINFDFFSCPKKFSNLSPVENAK